MTLRLAMLMDRERLHHERRLLANVSRALVERNVAVAHIVPEAMDPPLWEGADGSPEVDLRLETAYRGSPWLRSLRIRQLARAIERDVPDFLLAIGQQTWPMALGLGMALERPVGLEVWSRAMIQQLPRGRKAAAVAAVSAPTHALAEAATAAVEPGLVCQLPWGVPVAPDREVGNGSDGQDAAFVITGSCRDVPAYQSLLSGLSRVVRDHPSVQAFLELGGANEHEIWRIVSRLGLHANVTVTPDAAGPEQLLTHCDAMLIPERYGQVRSIILEAMGAGMTLIASEDPMLDMLIDEETALTLSQPDAATWGAAIRRILTDRDVAARLGRAAQGLIRRRHTLAHYAETLCETAHRARDGQVIRFPTSEQMR